MDDMSEERPDPVMEPQARDRTPFRTVQHTLGPSGKLRLIERALNAGDRDLVAWYLHHWGDDLKDDADTDVREQVGQAYRRFELLVAHEAAHGRFSLLDRSAPHVVWYEQEMRWRGLPSRFASPQEGDGAAGVAACSTASS